MSWKWRQIKGSNRQQEQTSEKVVPLHVPKSQQRSLSAVELEQHVDQMIKQDLQGSKLTSRQNTLAREIGCQPSELKQLYYERLQERELIEGRPERTDQLESLLRTGDRHLCLSDLLPPSLAKPLERLAVWMGVDVEVLFTILLPTAASLLHPKTRVVVKECIDFVEPLIFYSGIVSEAGNRKSPPFKAITKPLRKLQDEEDARYQDAQKEYERTVREQNQKSQGDRGKPPEPPEPPREFYVDNITGEALDRVKAQQPKHGFVICKDELSGLFGSYGAYKGGRGSDKESILSGWNGNGIKVNRVNGSRLSLSHDATSIAGAIQPGKLRKIMGNLEDEQGEWGRFLWYSSDLRPFRLPKDDTRFEVGDLLEGIFRKLDKLDPIQYRFTPDAQLAYDDWHEELGNRLCAEPRSGMRSAIAKMQGYTARMAGILHILWATAEGEVPERYIPIERVKAAIVLVEFYLEQVGLIHSDAKAAKGEKLDITAKLIKLSQRLGMIKARDVLRNYESIKLSSEQIRSIFLDLEAMGYGPCSGKGIQLGWEYKPSQSVFKTVGAVGELSVEAPTGESSLYQQVQGTVGAVGAVGSSPNASVEQTILNDVPPGDGAEAPSLDTSSDLDDFIAGSRAWELEQQLDEGEGDRSPQQSESDNPLPTIAACTESDQALIPPDVQQKVDKGRQKVDVKVDASNDLKPLPDKELDKKVDKVDAFYPSVESSDDPSPDSPPYIDDQDKASVVAPSQTQRDTTRPYQQPQAAASPPPLDPDVEALIALSKQWEAEKELARAKGDRCQQQSEAVEALDKHQQSSQPWYSERCKPFEQPTSPFTKGQRVRYEGHEYVVLVPGYPHTQLEGLKYAIPNSELEPVDGTAQV